MNGVEVLVVAAAQEEQDALRMSLGSDCKLKVVDDVAAVGAAVSERLPALVVLGGGVDEGAFVRSWRASPRTRAVPVLRVPAKPGESTQALREAARQKDEMVALLDSLLANAPIGFAFFDRNYRYLRVNGFLAEINGVPVEEHLGRTLREVVPVNAPFLEAAIDRVFATGEAVRDLEVTGETPRAPGVVRHWLCGFYPVRVGDGPPELVGAVVLEITDRKRAEEALRAVDSRKDRFLATLAHELRNPLAPIRNALEILHTPDASAADAAYARELLERQVRQMVRLIDDLLDVSRIRVGKIELRRERVALDDVVNAALETCRPALDAARHTLTVTLPPRPVVLDGDPLRLAQILANLLLNAAKYTPPGGHIGLSAGVAEDRVAIRVYDSGVGIKPEQLPYVFDMFRQPVPSGSGGQGGLGVGLGLVKALVELHGGTVEAHSGGPGRGSEFTVRLPFTDGAAAPRPAAPSAAPAGAPGRRVLVVDDSIDAARSLARVLRLSGHEVQTAHDGPAALAAVAAFAPEVVFLDIGMPGMDGCEVARRIRALPGGPPALLVALTGWGQEEDRRRTREAGIDVHLVKPVEPEQLRALLVRGTDTGVAG